MIRMWFSVARRLGKKPLRGAVNSAWLSPWQAASRR
ncbi:hypothetical protein QE401_003131 [Pseudoroseomonas cervicalis]|nr:hypothetical protein [Pseudoroseomonas cervicalis]